MSTLIASSYRSVLWSRDDSLFKDVLLILFGIILISFSAQFVIPLKPVPLTFQSASVILIGMLYGARLSAYTLLAYVLGGALGLPIFAHMQSGLSGPTMGYLFGFIVAAMLGGFLAELGCAKNVLTAFLTACLSATVIFAFGLLVLAHFVGWTLAFQTGVIPFLISEPLKLFAIALIIPQCWRRK